MIRLSDLLRHTPGRLENQKELINTVQEFENLQGFLEHVLLVTEGNENASNDMVTS